MLFPTTPAYDSRQHIEDALTRHEQYVMEHIANFNALEQDMTSKAAP